MKTPKPLPYNDVVPRDKIRDYIYTKTKVMLTPYRLGCAINTGSIRTIKRPRHFGGGVFSRKVWLDEYIKENS